MDRRTNRDVPLSPQENHAIAVFREAVEKEAQSRLIGLTLFGSRSREEGGEDSDVDILVLLSAVDDILKVKIWDIAYGVFADTDVMTSPLVLSKDHYERLSSRERLIARSIQEEGIPL